MKVTQVMAGTLTALALASAAVAVVAKGREVEQDPEVLRFVQRSIAWYPGSSFTVLSEERRQTPSGSFRTVTLERTCDSKILSGQPMVVIDEMTGLAYEGAVGRLPFAESGASPRSLRPFIEGFLPEAFSRNMNMKTRVSWDPPAETARSGALIPFSIVVDTGYGEFVKPAAVASDGSLVVMAEGIPLEADPVAVRRKALNDSEFVIWDTTSSGDESVEIVEFSDLECPACKARWPMIEGVINANEGRVRHGMVSFPLTSIHPWAFRASSASWCVAEQGAERLLGFKELFYELQRDMEVSLVTPTSLDFVAGNGLDEVAFRGCYLRDSSLQAVHSQLALGHRFNVNATPTYFVNGWAIQVPREEWFPGFIARLIAGDEP
jgi:protein-disulfide isomerase